MVKEGTYTKGYLRPEIHFLSNQFSQISLDTGCYFHGGEEDSILWFLRWHWLKKNGRIASIFEGWVQGNAWWRGDGCYRMGAGALQQEWYPSTEEWWVLSYLKLVHVKKLSIHTLSTPLTFFLGCRLWLWCFCMHVFLLHFNGLFPCFWPRSHWSLLEYNCLVNHE